MFLHKLGCEYYQNSLLKIIATVKDIMHKSGNPDELKADKILNEGHNSKEVIAELHKHMQNIMHHMKKHDKEKNVLEKLADTIENYIGGNLTDDNGIKLKFSKIVYQFEHMTSRYERLEKCINDAILHQSKAVEFKAKELLNDYIAIKTALDNIHAENKQTSEALHNIIRTIRKEKELIVREEEGLNEFHKNMLSWF